MRFLIIDDHADVRRLLEGFLKPYGDCSIAVDGVEGVSQVLKSIEDNTLFDAIFLDIMMPRMEGQEALRKIRELETVRGIKAERQAHIIMTTALDDSKNIMTAFKEQADAYLIKPIMQENLFSAMNKAGLDLEIVVGR